MLDATRMGIAVAKELSESDTVYSVLVALQDFATTPRIAVAVIDAVQPFAASFDAIEALFHALTNSARASDTSTAEFAELAACFERSSRALLARDPEATTIAIGNVEDIHHKRLEISLFPATPTAPQAHATLKRKPRDLGR